MRGPASGLLTPRYLLLWGLSGSQTHAEMHAHTHHLAHIYTPRSHAQTHTTQQHTSLHVKFSWAFNLERWKTLFITDTENNNALQPRELIYFNLISYSLTWVQRLEGPVISFMGNTYLIFTWNRYPFSTLAHMPKWKLISQQTRWNSKWHRNHVWHLNSKCKMHETYYIIP